MNLKKLSGRKPLPAEQRFALSYIPEPNSGCWLWLGSERGSNHYGAIKVGGKPMPAHRFSYLIHKGAIPDGKIVCHSCDVPACVNPDHLWLGTVADNNADKQRKGRQAKGQKLAIAQRANRPRGERVGTSKINAEVADAIRCDFRPQRKIAADFGISQAAVWHIKTGKTWSNAGASL